MKQLTYNKLINIVWYQAIWFIALAGQDTYEWVLAILLGVHLVLVPNWRTEVKIMLACGLIGISADSVLTLLGVYQFTPTPPLLPIPLWLAAIWLGFAGTFLHSFQFFITHPIVGTLIVGCLAPFSYMAGVRFGAVQFGTETLYAALSIAAVWVCLMPIFGRICNRLIPITHENMNITKVVTP